MARLVFLSSHSFGCSYFRAVSLLAWLSLRITTGCTTYRGDRNAEDCHKSGGGGGAVLYKVMVYILNVNMALSSELQQRIS